MENGSENSIAQHRVSHSSATAKHGWHNKPHQMIYMTRLCPSVMIISLEGIVLNEGVSCGNHWYK